MSRVRISNKPGDWLMEGPGFARTQGYGGSLVVVPSGGTRAERQLSGHIEACGKLMVIAQERCARPRGHNLACQTLAAVQRNRDKQVRHNERRRERRRERREAGLAA